MAGSFSWQSESFPGRPEESSAPFLRVISRALRAASRARAASMILRQMPLASAGRSSRNSPSFCATADSTAPLTSDETSLSLVCEENFGSGILIERIAVMPSRASSPVSETFSRLARPSFSMNSLIFRVSAARKPARWVPPSFCGMLFV